MNLNIGGSGYGFETAEFQKRQEELDNLRDLPDDWDSYDGQPPFTDAILKSESLLHLTTLYDIVPERVVASREGGVSVYFTVGDHFIDVEFLNNGAVLLGVGYDTVEDVTENSPYEIIERILWWKEKNK